jgi:hypothetical protein
MARVHLRGRGSHGEIEATVEGTPEEVAQVLREYASNVHVSTVYVSAPVQPSDARPQVPLVSPVPILQPKAPLTPEDVSLLQKRVPPVDQVEAFILAQPNREHSLYAVCDHFLGRGISLNTVTRRLYHRMIERVLLAREHIQKRDRAGTWKKAPRQLNRSSVWAWVPSGGSESRTIAP